MSLGKLIVQHLLEQSSEQLAAGRRKSRYSIEAAVGSFQARLELEDGDRLGCLARSVLVERTAVRGATETPPAALRLRAEQVTKHIGYLLEDLDVVEIDCGEGVCQIRSFPPARGEKGICYYELMLEEKGRAVLLRYEKCAGETHRIIKSMNLSLEVLQRLVDDLAAVV
jgi:hypothetical protein